MFQDKILASSNFLKLDFGWRHPAKLQKISNLFDCLNFSVSKITFLAKGRFNFYIDVLKLNIIIIIKRITKEKGQYFYENCGE